MKLLKITITIILLTAIVTFPIGCLRNEETMPPFTKDFLLNIPYDNYIDWDDSLPQELTIYDIRNYGAIGDGVTINTLSINNAIQDCHNSGGGLVLIDGGDYVTGTIIILSNVTLRIAKDAILRGSRDVNDYDNKHLIYAKDSENIIVEGPGKIEGEGEYFCKNPKINPDEILRADVVDIKEIIKVHFDKKRYKQTRPSPTVMFESSNNVTLRNLIINNPSGHTIGLDKCNDALVERSVINANLHVENTDGININCSNNVIIRHNFISAGDDGIVLKTKYREDLADEYVMDNIEIYDNKVMSLTNAFKIGTETYYDITNVSIYDCEFFVYSDYLDNNSYIWPGTISGITIQSVDGANISDVTVENITMHNVMVPIFIRLGNRNRYESKSMQGSISGINISNVRATNAELPSIISGVEDKASFFSKSEILYITDINLSDIQVVYREADEQLKISKNIPEHADSYPEAWMFNDVNAYGLWIRHTDNIIINNMIVVPRSVNTRPKITTSNTSNISIN